MLVIPHKMKLAFPPLPGSHNRLARSLLLAAIACAVLGMCAIPVDLAVSRFLLDVKVPGDLRRVFTWSEAFAHALGVGLIAAAVIALDPVRRKYWPRILLVTYGAGLSASWLKLIVGRLRPSHFWAAHAQDGPFVESATVFDTFQGWLPLLSRPWGEVFDHRIQSMPSGHTATAVGLAIALSRVYPRASWLFCLLAVLAAGQRMVSGSHYLSDILFGAAIAFSIAAVTLRTPGESLTANGQVPANN